MVVNFRNTLPTPVTMHPHGIFYSEEMDGAYKGKYTDPGGFVQRNQTFQYVWDARPGTEGAWLYHDHGPIDPMPVFKGLFGPLIVRDPGAPRPDREFTLFFHDLVPVATGLDVSFSCVNGKAYPGNTPTLEANVGENVAFHVYGIDNDFHTFHLHGHRWTDESGKVVDNVTLGPGDSIDRERRRGQPRPLVLPLPRVHPSAQRDERLVRGQLTRRALPVLACALAWLVALVAVAGAEAANRRISISDYRWSDDEIEIDLGEHVTWYWVGPDTVHSVTGDSPSSAAIDSDPGNNFPNHPVGDSFQVGFDEPGSYDFDCKLHNSVRGTITVSNLPGDPSAEPDPVPANRVDRAGPRLREIALDSRTVHRRGARLGFALDEAAKVYADYYRVDRHGRRTYAGYELWRNRFIGYNDVRFAAAGKHFDADRGRYEARIWAADELDNTSKRRKVRFEIRRR